MFSEGLAIPIVAICGGIIVAIVKIISRALTRRHEIELTLKQTQTVTSDVVLNSLREEIAAFKDLSTKYDMSVEHMLQRLEQRIARLESNSYDATTHVIEPSTIQTVSQTVGRTE